MSADDNQESDNPDLVSIKCSFNFKAADMGGKKRKSQPKPF